VLVTEWLPSSSVQAEPAGTPAEHSPAHGPWWVQDGGAKAEHQTASSLSGSHVLPDG